MKNVEGFAGLVDAAIVAFRQEVALRTAKDIMQVRESARPRIWGVFEEIRDIAAFWVELYDNYTGALERAIELDGKDCCAYRGSIAQAELQGYKDALETIYGIITYHPTEELAKLQAQFDELANKYKD